MRFTVLPLRDDDDWIGDVMSAVTRMVVKPPETPNDAGGPAGCASSLWTLMPCAVVFEMGATLAKAASANGGTFVDLAVKLCHPHCSKCC